MERVQLLPSTSRVRVQEVSSRVQVRVPPCGTRVRVRVRRCRTRVRVRVQRLPYSSTYSSTELPYSSPDSSTSTVLEYRAPVLESESKSRKFQVRVRRSLNPVLSDLSLFMTHHPPGRTILLQDSQK